MTKAFVRRLCAIVLGIALFIVGFSIGRNQHAMAYDRHDSVPTGFAVAEKKGRLQSFTSKTGSAPFDCTQKNCHFTLSIRTSKRYPTPKESCGTVHNCFSVSQFRGYAGATHLEGIYSDVYDFRMISLQLTWMVVPTPKPKAHE
jgi:hypothetical protein